MPAERKQDADPVLTELRQIRALLTLLLIKAGSDSFEIAKSTGMGASTIRRDFPAEQIAPFGQTRRRGTKA